MLLVKRKDLEIHYNRMSQRFYLLNGRNDVNLKKAFLNSLPEPLGNETSRLLQTNGMMLNTTSLGNIYQHVLIALEKLYNHQKFLQALEEQGKLLGKACDKPICPPKQLCFWKMLLLEFEHIGITHHFSFKVVGHSITLVLVVRFV